MDIFTCQQIRPAAASADLLQVIASDAPPLQTAMIPPAPLAFTANHNDDDDDDDVAEAGAPPQTTMIPHSLLAAAALPEDAGSKGGASKSRRRGGPTEEDNITSDLRGWLLNVDYYGVGYKAVLIKQAAYGVVVKFEDGSSDLVYYHEIPLRVTRVERCVSCFHARCSPITSS